MWPQTYNDLIKFPSHCSIDTEKIISEENASKHIAINIDKSRVRQIKIDGDVLKRNDTSDIRVDYLVLNESKKMAYLIELKGRNIKHAFEQLENTDLKLQAALNNCQVYWRVVYSSRTLNVRSNKIKKYLTNHPQLRIKNHVMKENI